MLSGLPRQFVGCPLHLVVHHLQLLLSLLSLDLKCLGCFLFLPEMRLKKGHLLLVLVYLLLHGKFSLLNLGGNLMSFLRQHLLHVLGRDRARQPVSVRLHLIELLLQIG